eukprot:g7707.t1
MTVCGVELYKTSDRPVTLFDNDLLTADQSSTHPEEPDVSNPLYSPPSYSHTDNKPDEHGWWSAEFRDGQPRFVSAVKLRNRVQDDGCCPNRLSFTDVLFDEETEPAFTLPNVAKAGTVVDVGRTITKIKFRNSGIYGDDDGNETTGDWYFMTVAGFQLFTPYVEDPATVTEKLNKLGDFVAKAATYLVDDGPDRVQNAVELQNAVTTTTAAALEAISNL